MEGLIGYIFFGLMGLFVVALFVGAGIAYLRNKKQDEMWENVAELDDDALDQMAEGKKKKDKGAKAGDEAEAKEAV